MAIFSEFWNFTILSSGKKKCAKHMGPIKNCPTDLDGQKAVLGTTIPHNSENKKKSHVDFMSG